MINENELLNIALTNIRKVLEFNPYKSYIGVKNREEFQQIIANDPAFGCLGLDDERYVIARVGGNLVTSLHRKIGDMYQALFAYLLKESFGLTENELHFSVTVKIGERDQIRSTDGLIRKDKFNQNIPTEWMQFAGIGFEVRSCYQIGDSKRIQADYDISLALKANNILPVMLVFCNTSLKSPLSRLSKSWEVYEGINSFNLVRSITGFNLYDFLQKNSEPLKNEIDYIFSNF
ncbi:type I restriction endonuclease [Sphaerospermopsis torques-reginae]|uniref:Type I restriction endonuclease n=1 Tax=Sphaerospermopsis torques-reginae ITEP-024 TaxID=984208 RepID=A0ABX8X2A1_9CYAN|nr:type I restriction endonuclease [Sphaerospermopsis torques-reginae]QYX32804.1 type I restriction endonuclease [Sphaerospermopsis torques-reginae ITEP-024]